jgi:ABC-type enterochelin transport system permease subunit
MEQKSMWLINTQDKKLPGFLLILLGIGVAISAHTTLLRSMQDPTEFFVVNQWWGNSWNNTSPVPGILLYILAGIFFMLDYVLSRIHIQFFPSTQIIIHTAIFCNSIRLSAKHSLERFSTINL